MNKVIKLECQNCKHVWNYKGTNKFYASCPTCHYKVNVNKRQFGNIIE